MYWHTLSHAEIEKELNTDFRRGLAGGEAISRLHAFGPNELPVGKKESLAVIFLRQFQSPLIYILFGASLIVFWTGEMTDGFIILFVLLFNAVVGTIQEGRARNTLAALKQFTRTSATVRREQREIIISDREIVPGDVLILQEGERIPADARVFETHFLRVDEAALTGESVPVDKTERLLRGTDLAHAEQKNMVFRGTHIVRGSGIAVAVETGAHTVIGKIGKAIAETDTEIPLKANIRYLSRLVVFAVGVISAILFLFGVVGGKSAAEMFRTVVALAVSVVPEGLPIVMTLVLAIGVSRMARRNALVKRLQAVEALGQARVIAVDKTGTITRNEMIVRRIFTGGREFSVSGNGYDPKGEVQLDGKAVVPREYPELTAAGKILAFSSGARVIFSEEAKAWRVAGDPTEAALLVLGRKLGFEKNELELKFPPIAEEPFHYNSKCHMTAHRVREKGFLSLAGAPEAVLHRSTAVLFGERPVPLSSETQKEIERALTAMSREGLRVVALAYADDPLSPRYQFSEIRNFTFVGLCGIEDSLRAEVPEAVARARRAGIRVVMITGDHRITAIAIGRQAGIYEEGDRVLEGEELKDMSDPEFGAALAQATVFARVTPEDKLRIIGGFRRRGEIVAMTGDGVNDAPSLVAAELGVAMGKIGTEVAKEASDIVLLDDNFGNIVSAIEEGRSIYKTIKKVILYLFSTSLGEACTIAGAIFLGYPLPILPAQIIWLNLVTDGFLDMALAMEPKEKGLLERNFERPKKYLIDGLMAKRMPGMAIVMAIGTLLVFKEYFDADLTKAWTMSLTVLAVFQWFNAWNCRSEEKSLFRTNPFSNKFLVGATAIIVLLQLAALYTPFMQRILHTTPLALSDWMLVIPVAFSIVVLEEIRKLFYRRSVRGISSLQQR